MKEAVDKMSDEQLVDLYNAMNIDDYTFRALKELGLDLDTDTDIVKTKKVIEVKC